MPSAGPDGGGSTDPGSLAVTGATVGSISFVAAVLVALGISLVRASRRPAAAPAKDVNPGDIGFMDPT